MRGTLKSNFPLLAPLKPNHPNHNTKIPKIANGKLVYIFILPVLLNLPVLGPITIKEAKAIQPPTECTIVLPAKS